MRLGIVARAVAASALACGGTLVAATPSHAVIGGSAAAENAHPFMASVQDGSGFAFCGGSVISSGWVLTAAHCVPDGNANDLFVVTGRTNLNDTSKGQRIAVSQVIVHPAYENSTHDVALLQLSTPTSSPAIRLAQAADDALEAAGTRVTVTGWGDQTPTLGINSTSRLRQVDLDVVSDNECGQTNFGFDDATGVCAAALLKDSCQGDSGGPLFAATPSGRVQIGVVSYGQSCALPKFPGVYSEVNNPAIRSFISTNTGV
ncbi:MAG TPA: serine protease [Mycobacteriales bacterium]|nr:serine protease [Mycobacteriales bacterium]